MSSPSERTLLEDRIRSAVDGLLAGRLVPLSEGSLRSLLHRDGFLRLLGPETSELVRELPQDLPSLLRTPAFQSLLAETMPTMVSSSERTLMNVTERGLSEGHVMDQATRLGVIDRIAQETLARELTRLIPEHFHQLVEARRKNDNKAVTAGSARTEHCCRFLSDPLHSVPRGYTSWDAYREMTDDVSVLGRKTDPCMGVSHFIPEAGEAREKDIMKCMSELLAKTSPTAGIRELAEETLRSLQVLTSIIVSPTFD